MIRGGELDMKKIWSYNNNNYIINIFEIDKGILYGISEGVVHKAGSVELLQFYEDYSKRVKKKIRISYDNTKVKSIEPHARKIIMNFADENRPLEKIATIGDNFFMRSIIKLYATLKSKSIKINSFEKLDQSIEWLKKD